jgi:hypothetical protein
MRVLSSFLWVWTGGRGRQNLLVLRKLYANPENMSTNRRKGLTIIKRIIIHS